MIEINSVSVEETDNYNELSGSVGDFRLWYRFPKHIIPEPRADAFLAACLIPAMCRGEAISIDENIPVSPLLLKNTEVIQDVFTLWGPYLHQTLRRVNVTGGYYSPAEHGNMANVAFYSGGVDGNYTYRKHQADLDYLLFAKGIDMQLSNDELYEEAFSRNQNYLSNRGTPLHSIETNVRFLGHQHQAGWNLCFGGGLSSIALAGGFSSCYIASGLTYAQLYPHGSNVITDPLWSNEHTRIIHDGAEKSRLEKIRHVMTDPQLRDVLRVCWQDVSYNCGKCEKCLRTMCSLRALDIETTTFPHCSDDILKNSIAKLRLYNEYDLDFLDENLEAAQKNGDARLVKTLKKVKREYKIRQILKNIDESFLGSALQKLRPPPD